MIEAIFWILILMIVLCSIMLARTISKYLDKLEDIFEEEDN